MYIFQISDFHIGYPSANLNDDKKIIDSMIKQVCDTIGDKGKNESLLVCICGDIIDSSEKKIKLTTVQKRYDEAKEIINNNILDPLKNCFKNVELGFCLGNHDITHLNEVKELAKFFNIDNIDYFYEKVFDDINFVFVNSGDPKDYSRGHVKVDKLDTYLKDKAFKNKTILVMHHTLLSMDERDSSSIINAAELVRIINKYQIPAILHGHTHGRDSIRIGDNGCSIIGVGAIIARNYPNVNSRFNLIQCKNNTIIEANNFTYHADGKKTGKTFGETKIALTQKSNYFSDDTFSLIYQNLLDRLKIEPVLYNVQLHGNFDYLKFKGDINTNFGSLKEITRTGEEYSYAELAEKWEDTSLDDQLLYFNHGVNFAYEDNGAIHHGIEYVINMLKIKETSNRAILTTCNTKKIISASPDNFTPSLISVQFGLDKSRPDSSRLILTMNLRALEASRFLKINICEALYLAEQIHKYINFNFIEITINAFRVQNKNNFCCFVKAKIDITDPNKMTLDLSQGNFSEITKLLIDKAQRSETVVVTDGLDKLSTCIDAVTGYKDIAIISTDVKSKLSLVNKKLEDLTNDMNELKIIQEKNSVKTEEITELEDKIKKQFDLIILEFKKLEKI